MAGVAQAAVLVASARWEGSHIAVDPTIPLQGNYPNPTQPQGIDLASIYGAALKIKQQQQDYAQQQQAVQKANSLRAILSAPGAVDPATGKVTNNALKALWSADTDVAQKVISSNAQIDDREAQAAKYKSDASIADMKRNAQAIRDGLAVYRASTSEAGNDPGVAKDIMMDGLRDHLKGLGYSPDRTAAIWGKISTMEPAQLEALATSWSTAADSATEEAKRLKRDPVVIDGKTYFAGEEANPETGAIPITDAAGHPVDASGKLIEKAGTAEDPTRAAQGQENIDIHRETEGGKAQILKDDDGTPYWSLPPVGDHPPRNVTLTGEPYTPKGATKIGTDSARSPAVMILQAFKHDFEDQNGRPPNAQELNDFNMNTQAQTKAVRDFATGPEGNQTRFNNVAVMHLELVKQYADALKNGDEQTINKLANQWKQEFGAAAPTNLDAVAQTAGQEVTKAVVPGAGGEAEREAAGKRFARYQSPEQFDGAINASIGLMGGQIKGLAQQYKQTTDRDDYGRLLLPDTKAAIYGQSILNLPVKLQNQWIYIPDQNKEAAKKKLQAAGYDVSDLH